MQTVSDTLKLFSSMLLPTNKLIGTLQSRSTITCHKIQPISDSFTSLLKKILTE